jgi:hypothetical protein
MPAIATTGTEVRVTPGDDVQIVYAPGKHEFTEDRSPFSVRVAGVMEEAGQVIGVFGDVISGHVTRGIRARPRPSLFDWTILTGGGTTVRLPISRLAGV